MQGDDQEKHDKQGKVTWAGFSPCLVQQYKFLLIYGHPSISGTERETPLQMETFFINSLYLYSVFRASTVSAVSQNNPNANDAYFGLVIFLFPVLGIILVSCAILIKILRKKLPHQHFV